MFDLTIDFGGPSTAVVIRGGVLAGVAELLRTLAAPTSILIVTDDRVGPLHVGQVEASLAATSLRHATHVIPAGEASKSLAEAAALYDVLARLRLDRGGLILAVGGGVVSDLAGFVAATWRRGVPFAICPTTLEADIDAAIGGKTAVDIAAGKNLVGAFHQPILVAVDPECLSTLDARDVHAGLAESVKHALVFSEEFLAWHETHADAILALQPDVTTELIRRNIEYKANVVRADPLERTGARMVLNFGHTIGHAIESACGYTLRHGECVALGMLATCRLSRAMGLADDALVERTMRLLEHFGLPTRMPRRGDPPAAKGPTRLAQTIDTDTIMDRIRNDKKSYGGRVRFVLLECAGRVVVRDDVPEQLVRRAYESLLAP
jgi:3-dehydroquinate synthase